MERGAERTDNLTAWLELSLVCTAHLVDGKLVLRDADTAITGEKRNKIRNGSVNYMCA